MSRGPARVEESRRREPSRRHYPALDGLRAVAIAGVVWHHCLPRPEPGWLGRGHAGVPLFFALSGYLITTLLLAERRATGDIALGAFWMRRSLRIFPLYYATLAGFVLALAAHEPSDATRHFAESLPFYASYTSNWFVDFDVSHPVWFAFAWSLATEEQFYLWWPTFLRFAERLGPAPVPRAPSSCRVRRTPLRFEGRVEPGPMGHSALGTSSTLGETRRGLRVSPIVPLGLALIVGVDQLAELGALSSWLPRGRTAARVLTSVSTAMLLGAGLAWALGQPRGFGWLRRALAMRQATTIAAAGAAAWIWRPGPAILLDLAFVTLVGAAASASGRGLLERALAGRALVYVGRVSYGVYLFHVPVLGSLQRIFPGLVEHPLGLFVSTGSLSLAVASLSHRYVEAPILALRERFRPARTLLTDATAPLPEPARLGWMREG